MLMIRSDNHFINLDEVAEAHFVEKGTPTTSGKKGEVFQEGRLVVFMKQGKSHLFTGRIAGHLCAVLCEVSEIQFGLDLVLMDPEEPPESLQRFFDKRR